jgi:hypothetical protein
MPAGPNFPSSFSQSGSGQAWSNLTNLEATDGVYATCTPANSGVLCQAISATGFGFALPSTATVTGIQVAIVRHSASGNNGDTEVQLIKGGTAQGNNKANTTSYGGTDSIGTYGSASDLWGLTFLYNDINASTFGVKFQPTTPSGATTVSVDSITVTVYYYTNTATANPGAVADVSSGAGNVTWTNPGNAKVTDGQYAVSGSLASKSTSVTDYLEATNFGFSISNGSTITGIGLSVVRHASGGNIIDDVVSLIKGGSISGNNEASATSYGTSDATANYGGGGDLWGLTLAVSDVNASSFGVALDVQNTSSTSATASVDSFAITVYYIAGTSSAIYSESGVTGGSVQTSGLVGLTPGFIVGHATIGSRNFW